MKAPAPRIDPEGPSSVRQNKAGPTGVMKGSWRDPDDIRPGAARRAREITGYRSYCPLRRMAAMKHSQVTERHIIGADQYRLAVDITVFGCSGGRNIAGGHTGFGPIAGPSAAAAMQARCAREVARLLARIPLAHRAMLTEIIILNRSLHNWCSQQRGRESGKEMGKLIVILDIIEDHFASDIDTALVA